MGTWKKIISVDPTNASTVDNSFITINADESVEVISFNDLPAIDPADYAGLDTVPEVLGNDPSNFLLSVHDVDDAKHKKLGLDNLAGFLATQIIVEAGINANTTVQGLGTGLTGDLDGDGSVGSADLLALLANWDAIGEADTSMHPDVTVYDGADVSVGSGIGNATVLDQSYWTVASGAQLDITTVAASDLFQIGDGPAYLGDLASNGTLIGLNPYTTNTFAYVGVVALQRIKFMARYKIYNSSGTQIFSSAIGLGEAIVDEAGVEEIFEVSGLANFGITNSESSYITVEFLAYESGTSYGCAASIDSVSVKLVW